MIKLKNIFDKNKLVINKDTYKRRDRTQTDHGFINVISDGN